MTDSPNTLDIEALRKGGQDGPWQEIKKLNGTWKIWDRNDIRIADGISDEVIARAIAAIPHMLNEIQRLRNENRNLEASCKIEWTRREQAEAMLSEILPRLCVCDCEPVSGCADAILREKVRAFLAETETEKC